MQAELDEGKDIESTDAGDLQDVCEPPQPDAEPEMPTDAYVDLNSTTNLCRSESPIQPSNDSSPTAVATSCNITELSTGSGDACASNLIDVQNQNIESENLKLKNVSETVNSSEEKLDDSNSSIEQTQEIVKEES